MPPRKGYTKRSKYMDVFSVGQKFGKWTVEDSTVSQVQNQGGASVLVKCECGTIRHVSCLRLLNGNSTGCECLISGQNSHMWAGGKHVTGRYLTSIRNSADRRGIPFSLSVEFLDALLEAQNHCCALSGLPIKFHYKSTKHTASLDRIDGAKGYVEGNVRWLHKDVNIMRNVFDDEYFINLCGLLHDRNRTLREKTDIPDTERPQSLFRRSKLNS